MALNTQIRATCLLLLVLLSLTSGSVLPPQVTAQGPELQQPLGDLQHGADVRARKGGTGSCSERRDGVPSGRV